MMDKIVHGRKSNIPPFFELSEKTKSSAREVEKFFEWDKEFVHDLQLNPPCDPKMILERVGPMVNNTSKMPIKVQRIAMYKDGIMSNSPHKKVKSLSPRSNKELTKKLQGRVAGKF
jgi:hypothetical protein